MATCLVCVQVRHVPKHCTKGTDNVHIPMQDVFFYGDITGDDLSCRSIATEAAKKEVQRTVLGVVQPGDTLPVPYGWQRAGMQMLHCVAGILS